MGSTWRGHSHYTVQMVRLWSIGYLARGHQRLARLPGVPDPAAVHRGQGQRLEQHVGHRVLDMDRGLGDPDQDHAAALP